MTTTNTVDSIDDLRGAQLIEDTAYLVLRYYKLDPNDDPQNPHLPTPPYVGGGLFRADLNSHKPDNGGTIIKPQSVSVDQPGRWKRVYDGPVAVTFFGAWNDGSHPSLTREAIQNAINFATNPVEEHSFAVVTFPARTDPVYPKTDPNHAETDPDHGELAEYAVDACIKLPRLSPYAYIVIRGDGQRTCQITRTTQGPLFICDQNQDNMSDGSYLVEHLSLAVQPPDFDYLAAGFKVPSVNSDVQITFSAPTDLLSPGQSIFIEGAGIFRVGPPFISNGIVVPVTNDYPGNALPHTEIAPDSIVYVDSRPGDLKSSFQMPTLNADATITFTNPTMSLTGGQTIIIDGAGDYQVKSVDASKLTATVTNTGAAGNKPAGTEICVGSSVSVGSKRYYLAACFTVPPPPPDPNTEVTITFTNPTDWLRGSRSIFISKGAGHYTVKSVDYSNLTATVTKTKEPGIPLPGIASPGDWIASDASVYVNSTRQYRLAEKFFVPDINADGKITFPAPVQVPASGPTTLVSAPWLSQGQRLFIGGGAGFYTVKQINAVMAMVTNTGAYGNALPGTKIAPGSIVYDETPNCRAFDWTPPVDGDFSRPEIHFNEMLFVSGDSPIVGLVHLRRGHRCRFYNCEFNGLDTDTARKDRGATGVAIWLENCGGTTIINSRNIFASGGLIKCSGGGELVMLNCRCEGAKDVPAFDFQESDSITLIGLYTEGRRENPALFRFLNCRNVVALNPGLATPDKPYTCCRYADGMLFETCQQFTVIQPYTTMDFTQAGQNLGNYEARAIRITEDCKYGVIRGLYCGENASDTDIEIGSGATDCYVESFAVGRGPVDNQGNPVGGLVGKGRLVADGLRGSPGFAWPSQHPPPLPGVDPHPEGYDLEIGGGDSGQPGALAGDTIIQLGRLDTSGNTAKLVFQRGPAHEFGTIWYEAKGMIMQAYQAELRLKSDNTILLESEGELHFIAGFGGAPQRFLWKGNAGNITRIDTMPHDQKNVHNYAPTVPVVEWQHDSSTRLSFNGVGVAFNGNSPIAKPKVIGSRAGNLALQNLLKALENLGLIQDKTTDH